MNEIRTIDGKYRLLSELGRGAMGVVYRAEQLDADGQPQREVAVKTIQPDQVHDPAEVETITHRFLREVQVTMQLSGPHSVIVHDSGRDEEGNLYYVMELVHGQTLKALLGAHGPLPVERAVHIAMQICEGLAEAHGLPEPVIHRDLKPANLFIKQQLGQDWAKIADFGIAKIVGEHTQHLTQAGLSPGSPAYMAPEQWTGQEMDGRTDLYALGIVLYEMLTGRVPFHGHTLPELMHQHLTEPPPPLPPSLPEALHAVVMQLLAKNPDERPPDALSVHHALTRGLNNDVQEYPIAVEEQRSTDWEQTETLPQKTAPSLAPAVEQEKTRSHPKTPPLDARLRGHDVAEPIFRHSRESGNLGFRVGGGLGMGSNKAVHRFVVPAAQPPAAPQPPLLKGWDLGGERWKVVMSIVLAVLLLGGGFWWAGVGARLFAGESAAVAQYRRAAEQGDAVAQFNLGVLYAEGRGTAQDLTVAAGWYRRAAEQGNTDAQNNLGALYAQGGVGFPQNLSEAMGWYRQAAEHGHAAAQNNLGSLYEQGRGVPQNVTEAIGWYSKAAAQGDADAQYNLGTLYLHGHAGEPPNYAEAAKWYQQAAEQGQVLAQYNLGVLYARGRGVPQDVMEAIRWYRKAANQGNTDAREQLKEILG